MKVRNLNDILKLLFLSFFLLLALWETLKGFLSVIGWTRKPCGRVWMITFQSGKFTDGGSEGLKVKNRYWKIPIYWAFLSWSPCCVCCVPYCGQCFLWFSNPCFELVSKNIKYRCDSAVLLNTGLIWLYCWIHVRFGCIVEYSAIRLCCWIQMRFGYVAEYRCDSAVLLNIQVRIGCIVEYRCDSAVLLNDSDVLLNISAIRLYC